MSHTRNIYFADDTFKSLEEMDLYDEKGKKLSRSNKIRHLVLHKIKDAKTADAKHFELIRRFVLKAKREIEGLEFVQANEKFEERIIRAIAFLENIEKISY